MTLLFISKLIFVTSTFQSVASENGHRFEMAEDVVQGNPEVPTLSASSRVLRILGLFSQPELCVLQAFWTANNLTAPMSSYLRQTSMQLVLLPSIKYELLKGSTCFMALTGGKLEKDLMSMKTLKGMKKYSTQTNCAKFQCCLLCQPFMSFRPKRRRFLPYGKTITPYSISNH